MTLNNTSRGLLNENNQILFIEYHINGEIIYSLPGGKVEVGESLKECVIREFAEETEIIIEAKELILLNEFINPKPNSVSKRWENGIHQIESIFRVERVNNSNKNIMKKLDIGMQKAKWLNAEELEVVQYYPEMPIKWFFKRNSQPINIYKIKK